MPLTMANIGEVNEIKRIGGNEETRRFLANLGFVAGAEITVVSAIGGNVIVNIKDSRVAVNSDMARHIMDLASGWSMGPLYIYSVLRSLKERRYDNDFR